jgi:replicative superfamily II helicase
MAEFAWLSGYLDEDLLETAEIESMRRLIYEALNLELLNGNEDQLRFAAEALELLALDSLDSNRTSDVAKERCARAFALFRVISLNGDPSLDTRRGMLRIACLGVLADQRPLAAKSLLRLELPSPVESDADWATRVESNLIDAWLLLLRKNGWKDLDLLQGLIAQLREDQGRYESRYLERQGSAAHPAAWELVALYHLARAAEILAMFLTQGSSDKRFDPRQQVEAHFDRALAATELARSIDLENLIRLLAQTAQQLLDNSLWTVARAVSTLTSNFVSGLISRENPTPVFDVLAPQRKALQDDGLARAAQRSVVVSLPTSSGKTLIAQFRILQALTQFENERGWVAYVVPSRALVNQITARLRRDFSPLGITVERVSPALEIDGQEASLLTARDPDEEFRILVTTPEKLDLLLRGGWEAEIGRPLTLIVVDEAHNLSDKKRGIKLELLLATINRECRNAQFLLLTPFILNASDVAAWLDPTSNQVVELSLDWQPNDRIVALARPERGVQRGDYSLRFETLVTNRKTLHVPEELAIGSNRALGLTFSTVRNSPNALAAAMASVLVNRGGTILLVQRPSYTWSLAAQLRRDAHRPSITAPEVQSIKTVISHEFGESFPLVDLIDYGIGVHHAGLPDETKILMEWLLEQGYIQYLVATTTIAQGVNFPVANVVFATHQYPYGEDMAPEDFWNIAGRAGRVDQGQVGVIALAANNETRAATLRGFVNRNVSSLNSTLVAMVQEALRTWGDLDLARLSSIETWSAFVQYLAHTYRQLGDHEEFAAEVEQVLRGTMGFQSLRAQNSAWANSLITSVREYAERLSGQPLSLVDSTGFSWESVSATLFRLAEARIRSEVWSEDLFSPGSSELRSMMGLLLQVPELRANLLEGAQGATAEGDFLARVVTDWVAGVDLATLANNYFRASDDASALAAMTRCCQKIFSKIAPTVAWGLSALQSMTMRDQLDILPIEEQQRIRNLPAFVYYGVNDNASVTMRLLGVPRGVASTLARTLSIGDSSVMESRARLRSASVDVWREAAGPIGEHYFRVWRILEGAV